MDVERPVERRRLAAPRGARQVVAQHLAAGVADEVLEEIELDRRQVDARPLHARLARRAFEPHAAGLGDADRHAIDALPPQHRAHPRHHLFGIERAADVVVGAALERRDRIRRAGQQRDHHQRQRAVTAEGAHRLGRVDAGHRRVEQHQAVGVGGRTEAAVRVRLPRQPQAARRARPAQQQRQVGAIGHEQHGRGVHGGLAHHCPLTARP